VRRNAALLPAYSFMLGLIALLGYMAIARGISVDNPNFAVPDLFLNVFPSWFVGVAFAAIAIGALVPAAVMSIAAANLFTRNVWREHVRPGISHAQEAQVARLTSLVVKVGALLFIILAPVKYAIDFQLLGGVWISQTIPSVIVGLYTRWLHGWALVAGWVAGMATGTAMAISQDFKPVYPLDFLGVHINGYTALFALVANLVVSFGLTAILRAVGSRDDRDDTRPSDFDELDEDVEPPRRPPEPAVVS
jgi:SSS family solute:Na+ symporter